MYLHSYHSLHARLTYTLKMDASSPSETLTATCQTTYRTKKACSSAVRSANRKRDRQERRYFLM